MRTVGLVAHLKKPDVLKAGLETIAHLEKRGVRVVLLPDAAVAMARPDLALPRDRAVLEAEAFLALGGDGTLLDAVHLITGHGLPVLGINMGRLGFLTEVEAPDAFWAVDKLLAGEYELEERFMLEARVLEGHADGSAPQGRGERDVADDAGVRQAVFALNDIVISRGVSSRMITLKPTIGPERVGTYRADGLIVATATGSTAYSLSAGGPIVHPGLDVLILTPICPHSLHQARSVVTSPDEVIRVEIEDGGQDVFLIPDGRAAVKLESGNMVHVAKSALRARLIKVRGRSFYEILRSRMSDDPHQPSRIHRLSKEEFS